jgi:glycosyltransferase involved in cell wall biosynthesis
LAGKRFLDGFKQNFLSDAFRQVLDEVEPDLVHIQHLLGLPFDLINLLHRQNTPYIITLHDFWWVCANAQLVTNYSRQLCAGPQAYLNCARCVLARAGRPRLWPAIPVLAGPLAWRNHRLRQALQAADKLIAPSHFVRNWYVEHGVPAEKIIVIPHGLDSPAPPVNRARQFNRPLRFAYIGGLSWQKGVHVLLDAFSGVGQPAELWLAGDEAAEPEYVAQLRQLASPGARFLGRLTREEVWQTLHQVDVVVVPALWYEAFSFIISEAFAAGAPVIASRLGSLAERVRHEVDGLLVPPNDAQALQAALLRFIQEPGLLPKLQAGIQPMWTMAEHCVELEALYKAILTGHKYQKEIGD